LENSFLSLKDDYIGDYDRASWYVKYNLKVCEDYPSGCAEAYDKQRKLIGYCGYTHRGANIFKKGMRLFDENYKPKATDYPDNEWNKYVKEHEKYMKEVVKEGWAKDVKDAKKKCSISDVIPFAKRGNKIIKTMDEAKKAAINLSKYLS